ncbi:MAG: SdrD B-like domain-containing protein [Bacteroidota bacterium]
MIYSLDSDLCEEGALRDTVTIEVGPIAQPVISAPTLPTELTCSEAVGYSPLPATYDNGSEVCPISGTIEATVIERFTQCGGEVIVTYRVPAVDACGDDVSITTTIQVAPASDPVIIRPDLPESLTCEEVEDFEVPLANSSNGETGPCLFEETNIPGRLEMNFDECGGSVTLIWTASSGCDNNANQLEVVIPVTSPGAPTITAPDRLVLTCGESDVPERITAWLATASASSACGAEVTITNNEDEVPFLGGCNNNGLTGTKEVTFTATACGESATATAIIEIVDDVPPVFVEAPQDLFIECSDDGIGTEIQTWLNSVGETGRAEDDCSEVTYSNNFTALADIDCNSITEVLFFAEDDCGNRDTIAAELVIRDSQAPVIAAPADIIVDCDTDITLSDPSVVDNCTPVDAISIEITREDDINGCDGGTITRRFIATDICGNADTAFQVITVRPDLEAPEFTSTLPADVSVEQDQIPVAVVLSARDNCSEVEVEITERDSIITCGFVLFRTWTAVDDCGNVTIYTQEITVDVPLEATINGEGVSDCDDPNNGSASVTVTSGQAPYTYLWSTGAETSSINNLSAGTYSVDITDASGCTISLSVTIEGDLDVPVIDAFTTDGILTCTESVVGFTIRTDGVVTSISGPDPETSVSNPVAQIPGTYVLEVTGSNGCTASASVEVAEDIQDPVVELVVLADDNEIPCNASGVSLQAVTDGTIDSLVGADPLTSAANPVATVPGEYILYVTGDNGCTASDTVEVVEAVCNASITLTKLTNGQNTDFQRMPIIIVAEGGSEVMWTYEVTNNGEVDLTDVVITDLTEGVEVCTLPTLAVGETQTCTLIGDAILGRYTNVATAEGTADDEVVNATDNSGYIGVGINVEKRADRDTICPGDPVNYELILRMRGGAEGISIRDIRVADNNLDAALTVQSPEFVASSDLNGNGWIDFIDENNDFISDEEFIFRYTLNPEETLVNVAMDTGFVYFEDDLIGLANNRSEVTVVVDESRCACDDPETIVSASASDITCDEDTVELSVETDASEVSWIGPNGFSSSDRSVTVSAAGEYIVTSTVEDDCFTVDTVIITDSRVTLDLLSSSTDAICDAENGQATVDVTNGVAPYEYSWSNGAESATITDLSPGTYDVLVTDANGCTGQLSVEIGINEEVLTVSAEETQSATCRLGAIGIAMATPSSGVAPYTYEWSDGQVTQMAIGLAVGDYTVVVTDANGCQGATMVTINEVNDCNACLGDFVWEDLNRNGIFDAEEPPIADIVVRLLDPNGTILDITRTDESGIYGFDSLDNGSYIVELDPPSGYLVTLRNAGSNAEIDSDFDLQSLRSRIITLDRDESNKTIDAGLYRTASVGDLVWLDEDCDGIRDASEPGVADVRVELRNMSGDTLASTVTDEFGNYSFVNLPLGEYTVHFVAPTGFSFTEANVGDDDDIDSDPDANGATASFVLSSGDNFTNIDAGLKGQPDVQLAKSVNMPVARPGDTVMFVLEIANEGNALATEIVIEDVFPTGYSTILSITQGGIVNDNVITWSGIDLEAGESLTITYEAVISDTNNPASLDLENVVQVVSMTQRDVDSEPNNDDGDQSEDDESKAEVMISICDVMIETSSAPALCDSDNGSVFVSASGGAEPYRYLWSTGDTTQTVSDLAPGSYDIQVTDSEGCMTMTSVVVEREVTTLDVVLEVIDESCAGDDGRIIATVVGGTEPYQFDWSTGATLDSIIDLSPGLYNVAVRDANGCSGMAQATLEAPSEEECPTEKIDLEIIKRVNDETPQPGDTVNFILTIFNNGDLDATGVSVVDDVPSGFTIIESSIDNGGVVTNINTITWADLQLASLELQRFTFRAIVEMPEEGRSFTNVARVFSEDQEERPEDLEDNEDSATAMPETADVAIEKFVSDTNPGVRDVVTYTIRVTNENGRPLTRVEVTDYLPTEYCSNFTNISDRGIFLIDRIVWTNINLMAGESIDLTFDATVSASALGEMVVNRAEVTDMDQTDVDSTPDNLGESPEEDDEAQAIFTVGRTNADVMVMKDVDVQSAQPGDRVEFSISVINNGPDEALGVSIEDLLPDGYTDVANLSADGRVIENRVIWWIDELAVDSMVTFTFDAVVVHFPDRECDYMNVARVANAVTPDDNATNNIDSVDINLDLGFGCVEINTAVLLEGAFDDETGLMRTTLNDLGYLPGQRPTTFLGVAPVSGQPYNVSPWNYTGREGSDFRFDSTQFASLGINADYPVDAVDWVLVSLRSDITAESTVCTRAALLLEDGTVQFVDDSDCCEIDPQLSYYIVIEHRNHLVVMSHLALPVVNGSISYDFRAHDSWSNLFGFGQKQNLNGDYMMYAGNGEQSTSLSDFESRDINPNDLTKWLMQNGMSSSYFDSDFNFAGEVTVSDKSLFLRNNGIFSDVPR